MVHEEIRTMKKDLKAARKAGLGRQPMVPVEHIDVPIAPRHIAAPPITPPSSPKDSISDSAPEIFSRPPVAPPPPPPPTPRPIQTLVATQTQKPALDEKKKKFLEDIEAWAAQSSEVKN